MKTLRRFKSLSTYFLVMVVGGLITFTGQKIIESKFFSKECKIFSIQDVSKYYPLSIGNRWIYNGRVKSLAEGSIEEQTINNLEININEIIDKENTRLVIMRGDFADVFSDKHSETGLVIVSNKVFRIDDENKIDSLRKRFQEEGESSILYGLVDYDEILFEFPLEKGIRIGEAAQLTREDRLYYWLVRDQKDIRLSSGEQLKDCYELAFTSLPDETWFWFCPHIGIVEWHYKHHGATQEADFYLSDYLVKY